MAYVPIAHDVPQYSVANPAYTVEGGGGVLCVYNAGTTERATFFTDSTGAESLNQINLSYTGFPEHNGESFLPHVDDSSNYKLALFNTAADVDDFSTALWVSDNIVPVGRQVIEVNQITGLGDLATQNEADLTFGITEIVQDDTPQLGGDLDCAGFDLTDVHEIRLDATPDADNTANGMFTDTIGSGEVFSSEQVVYCKSDGEWWLADASAESTAGGILAFALDGSGTLGDPVRTALPGSFIRSNPWSWTVGATLYLSTTAGDLTETKPTGNGEVVRVLGHAITSTIIYFNPSPSWEVVGQVGGSLVFIKAATASNQAVVDFTSADAGILDGTYDEYVVRFHNVIPVTDNTALYIRTSSDDSSHTYDQGASDYTYSSTTAAQIQVQSNIGSDTNELGISGEVVISLPAAAAYTRMRINYMYSTATGALSTNASDGIAAQRNAAEDVTAIRFLFSSGNVESGEFAIYGVKRA